LRRTRVQYHARVAEVLRERFPDTPPEILAHHYTEAGQLARAVVAWQTAGTAALGNFALAEALMHLQRGLAVLRLAGDDVDRVEAELGLRTTLGFPLMLTQGFASKEVEANYLRLLELCGEAGDRAVAQQFPALWGLWTFHVVSGDHPRAEDAAARLAALAALTGDTGIKLAALTAHGTAVLMRGRLDEARRAFEDGLAVYDRTTHAGLALLFGQDAGAMCASFLTWVHAHGGDLAGAEARATEALAMCDALAQPSTRAFVETVLATYRCMGGDFEQAERHSDTVIRLAAEQGMPHWDAQAQITRGWAIAGHGRPAEGALVIRRGIDALTGIGSKASMTFYWGALAEAELAAGELAAASAALDEAVRYMETSDERIHQAGLALVAARITSRAAELEA
jgi:predicted ATPase